MDRTFDAAKRHLGAMGSVMFEVGLFKSGEKDGDLATMILQKYKREDILELIPQFKFENCRGASVFIRPAGEHNLSMVDDLTGESIRRMIDSRFAPALVVETSPGNYQAWLKHSRCLPKELSTAVARGLAKEFGGDLAAADWRHFGRLSGFTNRKPKHKTADGLFPFVILREANGVIYDAVEDFVSRIELKLKEEKDRRPKMNQIFSSGSLRRPTKSIEAFQSNPIYAGDPTRSDLAYSIYALSRGVPAEQIEETIRRRDLSHKGGEKRQADYVARTLKKAIDLVNRS